MAGKITVSDVKKVASLAGLSLTQKEETKFTDQFDQTLKVIDLINELDTQNISPTSQVTNLENRTREDVIDTSRVLSQQQALSNAPDSYNGFFKVPSILSNEPQ